MSFIKGHHFETVFKYIGGAAKGEGWHVQQRMAPPMLCPYARPAQVKEKIRI